MFLGFGWNGKVFAVLFACVCKGGGLYCKYVAAGSGCKTFFYESGGRAASAQTGQWPEGRGGWVPPGVHGGICPAASRMLLRLAC